MQAKGLTAPGDYEQYAITGEEDQINAGKWVFSTGSGAKQDGKDVTGLGLALDDENLVYSYKIVVAATAVSEVHGRYTLSDASYPAGVALTSISVDGTILEGTLTGDFVVEAGTTVEIIVIYTLTPSALVLSGAEASFGIAASVKLATTNANLD